MTASILAYGIVVALLIGRHEPWADEAQAWLNGEIAAWRKITAEVKIELTD